MIVQSNPWLRISIDRTAFKVENMPVWAGLLLLITFALLLPG